MTDQTPTPDLADFRRAYAADNNEWWRTDCGHHMNLFDDACDQLDTARDWAAWFAAERDQAVDYDGRLAYIGDMNRQLLDKLDESRAEAGAARGSALALQARVMELQSQVTARDGRITELEAEQSADRWTLHRVADELGCTREQLDLWFAKRMRARITELEAAQAVLRPLIESFIDPDQCLFDHHGGCQAHGYLSLEPGELCPHEEAKRWIAANPPIVGTDAGTRHAAGDLEHLTNMVADFINQRVEYVNSCRNAHPDAEHDYYRWQGGAEARRQLAQRLGWTVPYELGEKTAPVDAESMRGVFGPEWTGGVDPVDWVRAQRDDEVNGDA